MAQEFGVPFLGISHPNAFELTEGRAPIDPNFVLAIERNQQNQTNEAGGGDLVVNEDSAIRTIVDEYKELALYEVFQGIVAKLIVDDDKMQGI